jgi:hypothetical protein
MPMKDMTGRVVFVLGATLGLPAALAAQACVGSPAPASGVAIYGAGGYFSYDLNQTIKGPQYGAGLALGLPGPVSFDFNGLLLQPQSGANVYVGNGKAFINVHVPAFASFCVTAGVGVSHLSDSNSQTSNTTFAVPLGLRLGPSLNLGVARLDPFVEPYVLFAQTTGTVFDIQTSASAVGGGADAGVMLHAGPILAGVTLRLTKISEDVGPHPYADRAVLVRLGLAF